MANPVVVPPLQVEECKGNYHGQVIGPVDPYEPLQFRVRVLQRPSGDVIVINLAHAAADAFGLHTLMSQLLQEYKQPGSISPAEGGIPERDTLWTRELYREGKAVSSDMRMIDSLWPDPFGTSRKAASFHRECISPPVMEALRAHARRMGGNLNDVVMAAYYLTMTELTDHRGPVNVFFPVNLRQHLRDETRVMSNQAANVSITLDRLVGEGREEILFRIIEETTKLKAGYIGIAEQVDMDKHCDAEGRHIHQMVEQMAAQQQAGLADIFISNPGPITLPDVEGLTGAYVCYPGGWMPTTCFVTSTFRGQMTITMGYQDSERARVGTQKAMHLFRNHLLSFLDGW
jgi:NRPS condensation-like uncharacterized protein